MKSEVLCSLTIAEAGELIRKKQVSPVEMVSAHLGRIEKVDGELNSFLNVMSEQAMSDASRAEGEIAAGRYVGPLHGIPIGLKDLYYTKGVATTAGSKVLEDFVPDEDATMVRRLKDKGAVVMGKLNMDEFARGGTNENPHFGPCRNPWNRERVPGGSSGGSGAAVSARLVMGALGSDTGGSIRIPAALCGIVGLKPTYGRLSTYGVVPLSWTLDHAGPMTRTVPDAAIMLKAMAGYDEKDRASSTQPVPDYTRGLGAGVKGLRLGVLKELSALPVDAGVKKAFQSAVKKLESLGARVEEVSVQLMKDASAIAALITSAEAYAYHEPFLKSVPEKYSQRVRDRNEMGGAITAVQYINAQRARRLLNEQFNAVFKTVDAVLTPTCAVPAPKIGSEMVKIGSVEESKMEALAKFTRGYNVTGSPVVSVPCGFAGGLPVGLQVVGKWFDEKIVLKIAYAYESATEWHKRAPKV